MGAGSAPAPRVAPSRLPATGEYWVGRDDELAILDRAWNEPQTNVVVIVAPGGVGKTSLVQRWRQGLAQDGFRGAERVFDWSFYSQDVRETEVSADGFFDETLQWFGEVDSTRLRNPWEKGARLAELVRQQRTLLVLDGLEPMQYPPGAYEGRLKDQALQALVRGLAEQNPGLCVITSRELVYELAHVTSPAVQRIELTQLDPITGAALLRQFGVQGEPAELEAAVEQYDGHALALVLLGTLLRDAYRGQIGVLHQLTRLDELHLLGGQESIAAHARRVMQSYELWFEREGDQTPLALLRLLGLFDRPATLTELAALRAAPPIQDLTDALFERRQQPGWRGLFGRQEVAPIGEDKWHAAVQRLTRAKLIEEASDATHRPETHVRAIDAHPLVREHFAEWLQQQAPEAWRSAHGRLYEHLKATTVEFPDTLAGLQPLYAAVAHGCRAGRHQDALDEVYWRRILRGNEHFSWTMLGAFGAELAMLTHLFAHPWDQPVSELRADTQAFLLNMAGFHLRALGRLAEAVEPMQAGFEARITQEDWENAAIAASNLTELMLTLGDVRSAVSWAERSVSLADRSGDAFERMGNRTTLADVLHQSGRVPEAAALFHEAEALQAARQPVYPLLYSLWGFRYCDLLLAEAEHVVQSVLLPPSPGESQAPHPDPLPEGEGIKRLVQICHEVKKRAETALNIVLQGSRSLLDIALNHLTLGRVGLLRLELEAALHHPSDSHTLQADVAVHLAAAVDGLRQAGRMDYLPRGLLTRAEWRARSGDEAGAGSDLREVEAIATRSGMRLHLADLHLLRTRLYTARNPALAREHLAQARALVHETGYHRRDAEVAALERALAASTAL